MQSGFRNLAMAWGWPSSRVIVVDHDQAQTATSSEARTGFQWIMTEVNLNHVGIILGFQVSRLSRANADWYHLLERCAVFHTLLADSDGIYDPTLYNDRLLLGLKGTMSEAELHFLGQRLYDGRLNKARRGEQFTSAPIGYVRSADRQPARAGPGRAGPARRPADLRQVRRAGLRRGRAPLPGAARHQAGLPRARRARRGPARVATGRPADPQPNPPPSLLRRMLCLWVHPSGSAADESPAGPAPAWSRWNGCKWEVMIPDAVPAYITWERYLANQERLAANRYLPTTPGVPRGGPSLLSGAGVLRAVRAEDARLATMPRDSGLLHVQ